MGMTCYGWCSPPTSSRCSFNNQLAKPRACPRCGHRVAVHVIEPDGSMDCPLDACACHIQPWNVLLLWYEPLLMIVTRAEA